MAKASATIDVSALKIAGEPNKYITYIDSDNGIRVYDGTLSNGNQVNFIKINSNGMQIYKGGSADANKVAEFGSTITIGNSTNSHIEMDFHSMNFQEPSWEHSDGIYFSVADLKDETGKLTYTDQELRAWGSNLKIRKFEPSVDRNYSLVIKKNGTVLSSSSYTIVSDDTAVNLGDTAVEESDVITASYTTTDYRTKFFTFGYRKSNQAIGPMSIAMGNGVVASGESCGAFGEESKAYGKASFAFGNGCSARGHGSVAEGFNTTASGMYSHAEGQYSIATGDFAHAEGGSAISNRGTTASGSASHAEGDQTTASSWAAHAEGTGTIAKHQNTHAQNYCTIAAKWCQTALGKFNIEDTDTVVDPVSYYDRGAYAVIVGNGTAEDARSNALTVDWNGGVELKNGLTQIYNTEYNSLNNTYYKTDGYHAFYATDTAGVASTGSFYIYGDHLMSSVPLNMRVSGTDYPVQGFTTGTSGNWRYRKWSGGKVEAWYSGSVSAGSTTAQTNIYRSAYLISIPSGIFSSTPIINISFNQTATTVFGINGKASSSTAISGNIFRANASSSSYDVDLSIYAWTN